MFSEKLFILLWFWYILLAAFTVFSVIIWLYRLVLPCSRRRYIKKYLILSGLIDFKLNKRLEKKDLDRFVHQYLKTDGVFLIRFIATNAGELIAADIVSTLWNMYSAKMVSAKMVSAEQSRGSSKEPLSELHSHRASRSEIERLTGHD